MTDKTRLGIIGATGMGGREAIKHQKFMEEQGQNYAELTIVTGSSSSAGRKLGEVFREKEEALSNAHGFWQPSECPEEYKDMIVSETDPNIIAEKADHVISALPSSVAEDLEPELRERGVNVFSNSSSYRWEDNVPLFIPEINHEHIQRVKGQKTPGKQANNPNCTTAGYVPVIGVLENSGHGVKEISLTTMQSISGKGDKVSSEEYSSWITGNVIDDWAPESSFNGEEEKSEIEPQKILGLTRGKQETREQYERFRNGGSPSDLDIIPINADTRRVPTQHGHLESLVIEFYEDVSVDEVRESLENGDIPEKVKRLPSTPENLVSVRDQVEPAKHVLEGNGMTVQVGDIRQLGPNKISLTTLSHNLRRGATWTARQSMELFLQEIEGREF